MIYAWSRFCSSNNCLEHRYDSIIAANWRQQCWKTRKRPFSPWINVILTDKQIVCSLFIRGICKAFSVKTEFYFYPGSLLHLPPNSRMLTPSDINRRDGDWATVKILSPSRYIPRSVLSLHHPILVALSLSRLSETRGPWGLETLTWLYMYM